jgi:hypothetical protein
MARSSSLDRSVGEILFLAAHGHEIQGMALQSYLFFGSANRLYEHVKTLLGRQPDFRFLLFDFRGRIKFIGKRLVAIVLAHSIDRCMPCHQLGHAFARQFLLIGQTKVHVPSVQRLVMKVA